MPKTIWRRKMQSNRRNAWRSTGPQHRAWQVPGALERGAARILAGELLAHLTN